MLFLTQDYADSIGADLTTRLTLSVLLVMSTKLLKNDLLTGLCDGDRPQERLLRADIQKYAKYIVYKNAARKISDVTVHERWTCRVLFSESSFVRTNSEKQRFTATLFLQKC